MKKNKKPLIVGNWKTNPATFEDAKKRFQGIKRAGMKYSGIEVVVCPPFPYIYALSTQTKGSNSLVGAQDLSVFGEGSKTGEVSASMIETSGARYVIIGHSERRALGETDAVVTTKVSQALKTDMNIIICVGEKDRDSDGEYLNVIRHQLKEALTPVARNQFNQIVIAYEPVWAIGRTDNVAITSHDLHQMVIYIKKFLREAWGDSISSIVPILYGGSVTSENAQDILWNGEVDGLLVGRASWEAETFGALFKAVAARQRGTIHLSRNKVKPSDKPILTKKYASKKPSHGVQRKPAKKKKS